MQHARLHEALAEALSSRGYEQLTPVQSAVLAEEADGRDLIVSAKTGSGKTVAFGMAMAQQLLESGRLPFSREPLALVIAPTRELAILEIDNANAFRGLLFEVNGARHAAKFHHLQDFHQAKFVE